MSERSGEVSVIPNPAGPIGPVVDPARVRVDLVLLAPDFRRPGQALRVGPAPSTTGSAEPDALVKRVELGLARVAARYRVLALIGLAIAVLVPVAAWVGSSVVAAGLLAVLAAGAIWWSVLSLPSLAALGPDYTTLAEAPPEVRIAYAVEAASGRWPRTHALLGRGPLFADYRPLLAAVAADPDLRAGSAVGLSSPDPGDAPGPAPAPAGPLGRSGLEPLTAVPWSVGAAAGIVMLSIALAVGVGLAAGALGFGSEDGTSRLLLVAAVMLAMYAGMLGPVLVVAARRHVPVRAAVGWTRVPLWPAIGTGVVVALAGRLIGSAWGALVQVLGLDVPGMDVDPTGLFPDGVLGVVMAVVVVVIVAPIAEEIVFRGVLVSALRDRWGNGVAVAASSLAFTAVHFNAYASVPIFVLGGMLAVIFIRTRSLSAPIAAHMIFNATGLIALYAAKAAGLV